MKITGNRTKISCRINTSYCRRWQCAYIIALNHRDSECQIEEYHSKWNLPDAKVQLCPTNGTTKVPTDIIPDMFKWATYLWSKQTMEEGDHIVHEIFYIIF